VSDESLNCGLLMETAQTHQGLVDTALERLRAHTRDLDAVVRDEIRRTLVEELQALVNQTDAATRALRALTHGANLRATLWGVVGATLSSGVALTVMLGAARVLLPSPREVAALSLERDELAAAVARLERHGGHIDLRRCGDDQRYCVRVDRKAPAYGPQGDFLIVAGY
jgi:hypothetical protein